jgi:ABC-type microcin C transport system permease subunit YejB
MKWIKNTVGLFIEDIFILSGLGLIVYQTYLLNRVIAIYLLGSILFIYGLLLAKNVRR